MNLSREANTRIRAAVHAVATRAHEAEVQPDLEAMKLALREVWHEVHRTLSVITEAERQTRNEALARIEGEAA